jgi:maleylacetate reductase
VLARALSRVLRDPPDLDARSDCLYGAWLCGSVLGAVSMALHHKLCHVLGGTWNLPHAQTHTIVLPHAAAYNAPAAPAAMARIAQALGAANAAGGLYDLAQTLGAPLTLKEIGMPEGDLARAADIATSSAYPNPRPLDRTLILELLEHAYHGTRPVC